MSLLTSRLGFKHRCTVERDVSAGTDTWGNPAPPDWQTHLADVLCRAWTSAAREPVDVDKTVVLENRRIAVPLGTDVTEADRVGEVVDTAGTVLFDGPMNVVGVLRHGTHLELLLERVR